MWLVASLLGIALPLLLWFFVQRGDRRHHEARMRLLERRIEARKRATDQSNDSENAP